MRKTTILLSDPHDSGVVKRRRLPLGPGTLISTIVLLAVVVSGWYAQKPRANPDAGRIASVAHSQGKPSRLWKPEVGDLFPRAAALKLAPHQLIALRRLDAAWQQEKIPLTAEMRRALSASDERMRTAGARHEASIPEITASLAVYSELSQQYDSRRLFYWDRATVELTRQQLQAVVGHQPAARKESLL